MTVNILGDEEEANQWKNSVGLSDILNQNDDESEIDAETQEIEVRKYF